MRACNYTLRQKILSFISKRNHFHPLLSREIEIAFNISGPTLRDIVRELRRIGEPIVASKYGYYMARSTKEVDYIVTDLQKRINSLSKTVSNLRKRSYEKFGNRQFEFSPGSDPIQETAAGKDSEVYKHSQGKGTQKDVLPVPVDCREGAQGDFYGAGADLSLDSLL